MPEKKMKKQFSRRDFIKLTAAMVPLAVVPSISGGLCIEGKDTLPVLTQAPGFRVELQIEDTAPFMPDGFYGGIIILGLKSVEIDGRKLMEKQPNSFAQLHYVHDDVEYLEFYHYGAWVLGESGLPRFVVAELL